MRGFVSYPESLISNSLSNRSKHASLTCSAKKLPRDFVRYPPEGRFTQVTREEQSCSSAELQVFWGPAHLESLVQLEALPP